MEQGGKLKPNHWHIFTMDYYVDGPFRLYRNAAGMAQAYAGTNRRPTRTTNGFYELKGISGERFVHTYYIATTAAAITQGWTEERLKGWTEEGLKP